MVFMADDLCVRADECDFLYASAAEESEEARDKREKRMLLGELAAGASLIILFCAAIG